MKPIPSGTRSPTAPNLPDQTGLLSSLVLEVRSMKDALIEHTKALQQLTALAQEEGDGKLIEALDRIQETLMTQNETMTAFLSRMGTRTAADKPTKGH